ncbi:MAG: LUD domain-containing protein [Desulfovibrio sp.]|jgi:iron-sulfur cluster protein|nr:LUD domain-containing protein [Desulfovibrio sp.]
MQNAKTMKDFHRDLASALDDDFLRSTLDAFALAYRTGRAEVFADMDEPALVAAVAGAKDAALDKLEDLYLRFRSEAEKRGVVVHRAATAAEANALIVRIAHDARCRAIVKAKSMTTEEIRLSTALEDAGLEVVETDLGEWITQLRREGPTHMVLPAIHLSRHQVAELFAQVTQTPHPPDIGTLVKVARRALRPKFTAADMGITGANFAVAENAAIGLCTNEGNARLVTTLPRVHVALVGLEKLVPTVSEALDIVRILPRNATAQAVTAYVTWLTGRPTPNQERHIVFLDNGRAALAKDPVCRQILRCVRCGACANVCPVYRLVGGHKMGHIYIGAIGLILTYFYHGREKARHLIQNCIGCEACKQVCAAGIDLPAVIREIRSRLLEEEGAPLENTLLAKVMTSRRIFHALLRFGKWAQRPLTGGTPYIRHLPDIFRKSQGFRSLPAIAGAPFRVRWPSLPKRFDGRVLVGLFAGCAQDFVYPEQLEAAITVLNAHGCRVDFPLKQNCCGLPLHMLGERDAARALARENIRAFDAARFDHILTLCPSCASHIRHAYPRLLADDPGAGTGVQQFASRIRDFSSFLVDILGLSSATIRQSEQKICYHASCHLCRGLSVTRQPRELLTLAATYVPTEEEDSCCGFGGSYSLKFPEISRRILDRKLSRYEQSGADILAVDCPGCIIQFRGGEEQRGNRLRVLHIAEIIAGNLKQENGDRNG